MQSKLFYIYSFYQFTKIKDIDSIKKLLMNDLSKKFIKGTILLANEGINASIAGHKNDLDLSINFIKKTLGIKTVNIKINRCDFIPFNRMKIRLKKEIVSIGKNNIDTMNCTAKEIDSDEWDSIIKESNIKLLDVRNTYEINIGKFKNSLNPITNNFREFPKKFKDMKINKNDKIAMYCTGGIRCHKASSYLIGKGYKNIVQLKGGIIEYLNNKKNNSNWEGECFVFDNRVSINNKLLKGSYEQCHGCRSAISKKDMQSPKYKKGICCPHCYDNRSKKQISRSTARQQQIDLGKDKVQRNIFRKIYNKDKHL